jgi:hypothetical protein
VAGVLIRKLMHGIDGPCIDIGKKHDPDAILQGIIHYLVPVRIEFGKVQMGMCVDENHRISAVQI